MKAAHKAWVYAALLACAFNVAAAGDSPPKATTAGTTPSITDLVGPAEVDDVQYSPGGKYIAAVIAIPDTPHENAFAIFDGRTGVGIRLIHSGKKALIARYFWANDDRLVASLAVQHDALDTPASTGEIFAINPDGSHQEELFGMRKKNGEETYAFARIIDPKPLPSGQILIATNHFSSSADGTYTEIQRIDTDYGRAHYDGQAPARNATLFDDNDGQVRVAVASSDGIHTSMWTRPDNKADWKLVNDPLKSGIAIEPIGFNRDNTKLYVQVSQDKKPDAIELLDMGSLARTTVYQPSFASPLHLLRTADGKDYYAIVTADGKTGLHFLDENSNEARLTKALQANFPGEVAYFSSFTRDGEHAIVHVASDRDPGDYFLFDLKTMQAHHLIRARSHIDPEKMRPMEPVALKARDGLMLHGFLTLPEGKKPYPLVVLPHGGPHGIFDTWGFDGEVQLLATHGYAVLQVNYRGSGGYGSWFQTLGYRQWGLSMQDDLTDATHWAIEQGYTSSQRICIYGGSYGGYAALEGVVREPDLYKCAIGYAGVYDLRVQVDHSDTSKSTAGDAYLDLALGTDRNDLLARSPLSGVAKIKANLLLIHGGEDPRVPIQNFRELTKALDKNGTHYEQLVMPNEGHGFFVPDHKREAYEKMLDFLGRNIGDGASTTATAPAAPL
ncbi:MAG TPA: S9 family peptidase [Dyella sp.]|uniref:S9 family peptidase n=1 Tax=Dyella sp. TaxID=1869338 RepID=UPI002F95FC70